ncbi:MAG: chorismate synthase [Flavipsychrobacter sp.]
MNSFGRLFRVHIFGESHGQVVGVTVDGCPAGISLSEEDFFADIARRKPGGKGTTPRVEADSPNIVTGVFNGKTTGAPITILFENTNTRSKDYEKIKDTPRPGHADFVLKEKYKGFNDYRGGGHSSGRLTVCLVAAGVIAKKIIKGIEVQATLTEAGGIEDIELAIEKAIKDKDSIGGIVTCKVQGLPIGLGEPFFDSMESAISHAVFAIPAIKGIEFGSGFAAAKMKGSQHNDAILDASGTTETNNAGGINGGVTNGNDMFFRVAVKPTSSTPQQQTSWNEATNQQEDFVVKGRHDLCIALRVPVVVEAVTAMVIADMQLVQNAYL